MNLGNTLLFCNSAVKNLHLCKQEGSKTQSLNIIEVTSLSWLNMINHEHRLLSNTINQSIKQSINQSINQSVIEFHEAIYMYKHPEVIFNIIIQGLKL